VAGLLTIRQWFHLTFHMSLFRIFSSLYIFFHRHTTFNLYFYLVAVLSRDFRFSDIYTLLYILDFRFLISSKHFTFNTYFRLG
jgi:hypothetical protein